VLFTLEALPAAEGDCLLLHWGTANDPKIAVIDGGPGRIYEDHLRPRLDEIVVNLNVNQLPLELVMISHMDSDHIVGIKKLLRALKAEVENQVPANQRPLRAKRLWHNVFNDILGDGIDKYYKTLTASLQASRNGRPTPEVVNELTTAFEQRHGEPADEAREDAWDVALVLAGHGEGRDVRDDHKFLFDKQQIAALNTPFKDNQGRPTLITAEMTPTPVKIAGLEFRVAGPLEAEIEALQEEFDEYITTKGLTAAAVLAAYADKSVKNLSSIVCLVEFGGKSILLTGDARGDKILDGLEAAGLLPAGGTRSVDVLKVPHHGSDRNVTREFFERVVADTYVLSGDGKHGNPDRDTLQWILDARGAATDFRVILTYEVKHIDKNRKLDFQKKNKPWNKQRDSLATFFKVASDAGAAFTLHAGAPVKIDLGDEAATY
jgi:beta-lactamase superfamily II metal-dependent hydrolase